MADYGRCGKSAADRRPALDGVSRAMGEAVGVTASTRLSRVVERVLRSRAHGLLSRRLLLLTCTARPSGRRITVFVEYRDADGALVVRSRAQRAWWRHLRGGVPVTLHLRGTEL